MNIKLKTMPDHTHTHEHNKYLQPSRQLLEMETLFSIHHSVESDSCYCGFFHRFTFCMGRLVVGLIEHCWPLFHLQFVILKDPFSGIKKKNGIEIKTHAEKENFV